MNLPVPGFFAALAAVLSVAACGGSSGPDLVPFREVAYLGWLPKGDYIIRTADQLTTTIDAAWKISPPFAIGFNGSPLDRPAPVEAIDFTAYTLLAVSLDSGNTCQDVVISRVEKQGDQIVVEYRILPPGNPTLVCYSRTVSWNSLVVVPNIGSTPVVFRPEGA